MKIKTGVFSSLPYIFYDARITEKHYVSSLKALTINDDLEDMRITTFDGGFIVSSNKRKISENRFVIKFKKNIHFKGSYEIYDVSTID